MPDKGAWGLAVNDRLNRVYVSFRETATLVTLDAGSNWEPLTGQTIQPCGGQPAAPFGLAFDSGPMKLFVACAPVGSVNSAVVYQTGSGGLVELKRVTLPMAATTAAGWRSTGPATTPSSPTAARNNVSIIGHPSNQIIGTEAVGQRSRRRGGGPVGGQVIIGNRGR